MIHKSILKKRLLFIAFALLVIVGQASAQSVSLKHVPGTGGSEGIVSGQGTQIVVELSQTGITQSVNAIEIVFDFDTSVLTLTGAPAGFIITGGNTASRLSLTAAPVPASASFTFTTKVDVTGREFSIGIRSITLNGVTTLTPSATIAFNSVRPQLYLDTQIESPAQNNNVQELSEKQAGDTLQFQLFAPDVAGQQFNAIELELSLQGKRLSSSISSSVSGGWISRVSSSGNLSLTLLVLTPISVPRSGYLGQVDLMVTGALTSSDMLMVRQASLDTRPLDVSGAVITFVQAAAPCPGDFDGNGMVNVADFLAFVQVFGTRSSDANYNALMDMDSSGSIEVADFLAFVQVFGTTCEQQPPSNGGGDSPDLIVESPSVNDNTLTTGQSFTLQATVRNQGSRQSAATTLRYYRSSDATISTGDTSVGTDRVDGLAASGTSAESISLTAPSSAGTYYYGACVASVSGESNTNNNCSPAVQVTVSSGSATPVAIPDANLRAVIADSLGKARDAPVTRAEMATLTRLAAPNSNIRDLTGLEYATGLTWLHLGLENVSGGVVNSNDISDLSPLSGLTNLTVLELSFNSISDVSALSNLTNLRALGLSFNSISDASALSGLTNLQWLYLFDNDLTGGIPSELGNLTNLIHLNLGSNDLTGGIPSELGNLTNLRELSLSGNQLSGSIPTELGNLTNLQELWLHNNASLSGPLPGSFTGLGDLEDLRMGGTGLCAPTDAAFQTWLQGIANKQGVVNCSDTPVSGDRAALVALYNATDGPNWTNNTNWLSNRPLGEWHGVTTDANGRVTRLILDRNGLSGSIPTELGNLTNLTGLYLIRNQLSGSIPTELGNLTNLTALNLSFNELSGSIPTELGSLTNLTGLNLRDNQLSGPLPSSLGNLSNLTTLYLYTNQLSGPLPSSLGNLTNLKLLDLSINQLSGSIPTELGNLTNLTALGLGANQLSGSIPTELGNLTNLTQLILSGTQLSGSIPAELGNLTNLQSLFLSNNAGLSGPLPGSFTGLNNLRHLHVDGTGLCVPTDAAFQRWLQGIANTQGVVNCGSGSPDLIVESPSVNDNTLTTGQSFTLSATVRNQGNGQSAATTLRYYRSSDAAISTGDTSVGTDAVDGLAASRTSAESISLNAPSSSGTYYYGACVESVSGESDPNNNCSNGVRVTVVTGPDLVVESPSVSNSSPTAGQSFTLSATVRNQGGSASASTTLRYYRSSNATISTSDTSVGTDRVDGLAASRTSAESISLTAPSSAGTYYYGACVASVSGESNTNNNCSPAVQVTVSSGSETAVDIPDANLRAVIADSLGKASGAPITRAEMATLTQLDARRANISDLTGLEFATSLEVLDLGINSLSDVSALAGLTSLRGLGLGANSLSDVSALAGLTSLEVLDLSGNSLSNVSALAGLTSLRGLGLGANSLSDVSALTGLTSLEVLDLSANSLSNVSALSNLTNLIGLSLSGNSLSNVSALSNLTNLRSLFLSNTGLSDVSALSGLTNLTTLWLPGNRISDIAPLVTNTGLGRGDEVDVRNNPLSGASRNTHIPALQSRGVAVYFGASKPATEEEERGMISGYWEARILGHSPTGGSRALAP